MPQRNDPDTLKIPAYMRSKAIVKRDRQRLLWTAWDRKEAGVKPNSPRALGKVERTNFKATSPLVRGRSKPSPKIETVQNETEFELPQAPSRSQKFPYAGETTHYLSNINVAIIKTAVPLKIGDVLLIEGNGYLFTQPITEMQIDRKPVKRAKKGSHIGLKVTHEVTVGGTVHLLNLRG